MQSRDQIRTDVQNAVRDAVRSAREAAREAGQPAPDGLGFGPLDRLDGPSTGQGFPIDPAFAVDVLRSEIAGVKKEIGELTAQLTNGLPRAREEAITEQLDMSRERLSNLTEQLDRTISGSQQQAFTLESPPRPFGGIPPEVVGITNSFFVTCAVIAIGIPLARAFGRWLDRRGQKAAPADSNNRFDRMEQAIDAVAIEVERISEGQRYSTKLMSELRGLPAPNVNDARPLPARSAAPIPVASTER